MLKHATQWSVSSERETLVEKKTSRFAQVRPVRSRTGSKPIAAEKCGQTGGCEDGVENFYEKFHALGCDRTKQPRNSVAAKLMCETRDTVLNTQLPDPRHRRTQNVQVYNNAITLLESRPTTSAKNQGHGSPTQPQAPHDPEKPRRLPGLRLAQQTLSHARENANPSRLDWVRAGCTTAHRLHRMHIDMESKTDASG